MFKFHYYTHLSMLISRWYVSEGEVDQHGIRVLYTPLFCF